MAREETRAVYRAPFVDFTALPFGAQVAELLDRTTFSRSAAHVEIVTRTSPGVRQAFHWIKAGKIGEWCYLAS